MYEFKAKMDMVDANFAQMDAMLKADPKNRNSAEYQLLQEWVGATDGTADDSGVSGVLTIYDPSSAYIKHFTARTSAMYDVTSSYDGLTAGYINDVTPIDEINFRMSADAIDTGTIYMYGVS